MFTGLEVDYLSSRHNYMFGGADCNASLLASFYYVPLADERAEEVGSIRMASHTDFGTVTLILNDNTAGLEVKSNISF